MAQHNAAKNFIFAFFLLLNRVRVLVVCFGDALPFVIDLQEKKYVRKVDLAAPALFEDGIISRKVYPVVPPKTEYALTGLGKATVPIVREMDKWGIGFFTQLGVPIPCDEE